MDFDERAYRTLVVSSSEKFNDSLSSLLTGAHCEPVAYAESAAAARRYILEKQFDFVIINAPLPDETGTKLAIDVSGEKNTVCLVFVRADMHGEIRARLTPHGVFILPKPTSAPAVSHGLDFLASARERLRNLEKKSVSIEEKMEEIRLVNRAKWLLIENLKMTEPDAHRYIEKQAMDRCVPKRDVSIEIINTYK